MFVEHYETDKRFEEIAKHFPKMNAELPKYILAGGVLGIFRLFVFNKVELISYSNVLCQFYFS